MPCLLDILIALPALAFVSLLFWAAHPLMLPLGWGIVIATAIWARPKK